MSFEELAEELNSSEIEEEGEEIEEQELDEESDIDEDNDGDDDDDDDEEESESLEDLGEEQKKEKATKDDKKVTIKVNGEEQEDTIENVVRDAQKWRASSNKFQEASKKEKELQNIQGELKKLGDVLQNDPMSIIKQFHGEDGYRKFMEKEIMALIEEENMPADQKEARRIKSLEDKYQRELEERELKIAEYEAEKKYQFYNSIIEKEIAESGLPNNKQMKALYAQKIKAVLPNMSDHEELPMGAITKSIREEMKG